MSEMQVSAGPVDIGEMGPRPFAEIPGLWMKVTQMSQEFFSLEAPRTSGVNTLLGVVIYAAVVAIVQAVIRMLAGPAAVPAGDQLVLLTSMVAGFAGTLLGFYVGYGLQYLGARILGGSGSFGPQVYLMSLFIVPIGILTALSQLMPYALSVLSPGSIPLLIVSIIFLILLLVLIIYGLVLNARVIMVMHRFTAGRAVAAMLLPALVAVLVCCGGLLMLGPVVNNVFSNVMLNVPTPAR